MKCLGVDIGTSSIKIAEAESSGRGAAINQYWEFPLSGDPTKDQALEVIERLRAFSSSYPHRDARWIVSVPQSSLSVRLKRFPFKERQKILKSLPFELEDDIPFDTSETVFDARVIENYSNACDVLAVACPHEHVKLAMDRAEDGGFEASLITAEGFALANLLEPWRDAPQTLAETVSLGEEGAAPDRLQPAFAVLQIGHSHSVLIVYRNSRAVAIRSMQWGGHDACIGIEATFKVPYAEAMKVLQTKSFVLLNTEGATRDQLAMHKAITESATGFLRELKLSLLDVKSSAHADVKEIFITGGASQIQNLAPWLTQTIELPVNPLAYLNALATNTKVAIRIDPSNQLESMAGSAIGLAIEGLRKARSPAINFRRGVFAQSNEAVRIFWERWKPTVQITAGLFFVFFGFALIRDSMSLHLAEQSDETLVNAAKSQAGLKNAAATASGVTKYIQNELKEIKNRTTLAQLDSYIPAIDILLMMSERFPVELPPKEGRGLNVDHVSIDNDDVVVEGRVQGADILAGVEKELKGIAVAGSLKKIAPTNLRKDKAGVIVGTPFGFALKVHRKP